MLLTWVLTAGPSQREDLIYQSVQRKVRNVNFSTIIFPQKRNQTLKKKHKKREKWFCETKHYHYYTLIYSVQCQCLCCFSHNIWESLIRKDQALDLKLQNWHQTWTFFFKIVHYLLYTDLFGLILSIIVTMLRLLYVSFIF